MPSQTVTIAAPNGALYQTHIVKETVSGSEPGPGLIMFSPIFGPDADMLRIAQDWAMRGYLVAVPDYYHRVAPGALDRSDEGRKAAMARWKALDVDTAIADIGPLKDYLMESPDCNGKVAALGFCAGGELAFLAVTRLGFQAAGAYHGTNIDRHLDEAGRVRVPVSLHFGGADPLVPPEKVAAVEGAFAGNDGVEIAVYPGAEHGFSFAGRPSYHQVAATESDRKVQAAFATLHAA